MARIEMVDPEQNPTRIKVVGVGGGGGNAVNRMVDMQLSHVEFISINTDRQAMAQSKADVKLVIGESLTGGLGAGTNPERGEQAALEDAKQIEEALKDSDMIFVASGFGGGTGTGASPVIARIAKELGALTVGVITKPFRMEGTLKMQRAEEGIKRMLDIVDSLIVIPNQNLIEILPDDTTYENALRVADDVLHSGVRGISDIITIAGTTVNVDFADVKTMLEISKGRAHMGIGMGKGDDRITKAVEHALNNPLLEVDNIKGAKGVLGNILGPKDLSLKEFETAMNMIHEYAAEGANIKIGTCTSKDYEDEVKITIVATGFSEAVKEEEQAQELKDEKEKEEHGLLNSIEKEEEDRSTVRAKRDEFSIESVAGYAAPAAKNAPETPQERKEAEKPEVREYVPAAPVASDSAPAAKSETEQTEENTQRQNSFAAAYSETDSPQEKKHFEFDVIPENQMRLHQQRGEKSSFSLDEDDLETPAFLRQRFSKRDN